MIHSCGQHYIHLKSPFEKYIIDKSASKVLGFVKYSWILSNIPSEIKNGHT